MVGTGRAAIVACAGAAIIAVLASRSGAVFRTPGCQVKYADDGRVIFLAHQRGNIFQRLLVLAFPSHVPMRDLEVWSVDAEGKVGDWVWSVVCPADVPWLERITFGDVPGGCSQLLPRNSEPPPPLQPGMVYGVNCSRGDATFVLDGSIAVEQQ